MSDRIYSISYSVHFSYSVLGNSFALAYSRTIRTALSWVAGIAGVVDTRLSIRTWFADNSTAGQRFGSFAFSRTINRYACSGSFAGIAICFAITTAYGLVFLGADLGFGFTNPLRISDFALSDAEVAVLRSRAG